MSCGTSSCTGESTSSCYGAVCFNGCGLRCGGNCTGTTCTVKCDSNGCYLHCDNWCYDIGADGCGSSCSATGRNNIFIKNKSGLYNDL